MIENRVAEFLEGKLSAGQLRPLLNADLAELPDRGESREKVPDILIGAKQISLLCGGVLSNSMNLTELKYIGEVLSRNTGLSFTSQREEQAFVAIFSNVEAPSHRGELVRIKRALKD